jgi:hypothetical protein
VQHKLQIFSIMSTGTDGSGDLGKLQTPGTSFEVTTAIQEGGTRTYRVINGATNQAMDLAGLASVEFIALKTDKEITIRLNGSESITVKPPTDFSYGYLAVSTESVTSIDVSNSSGDTAVVQVQLGGDI